MGYISNFDSSAESDRLKAQSAKSDVSAEEVGFEPTVPCGTTVFKTAAFDHSATPPFCNYDNQQQFSNSLLPDKRFAGVKEGIRCGAIQSTKQLVAVIEGYIDKGKRPPPRLGGDGRDILVRNTQSIPDALILSVHTPAPGHRRRDSQPGKSSRQHLSRLRHRR